MIEFRSADIFHDGKSNDPMQVKTMINLIEIERHSNRNRTQTVAFIRHRLKWLVVCKFSERLNKTTSM